MHIGIYGGSFNPIHHGHLILAQHVAELCGLQKMLMIPCHTPVHKSPSELAPAHLRWLMVQESVKDHPLLEGCDIEINRKGPSYTVDTMEQLHEQYPSCQFSMMIGSDTLVQLSTWYKPERILQLCRLLVLYRPGFPVENPSQYLPEGFGDECITMIEAPHLQISSSDIRQRVAEGRSIRYLTTDKTVQIIGQHQLYLKM